MLNLVSIFEFHAPSLSNHPFSSYPTARSGSGHKGAEQRSEKSMRSYFDCPAPNFFTNEMKSIPTPSR
jgi:hypothetical protein